MERSDQAGGEGVGFFTLFRPGTLAIVDANAVLSSVDNDCRYSRRSRMLRSAALDTTRLFAADHVLGEIYEKLPRIADASGLPVEELKSHFEAHYLPLIRFVTVEPTDPMPPAVAAITDPDDVPTGQLAHLLAPVLVLSEDKHLRKPGFAPSDWRTTALHTSKVSDARAAGLGLTAAVALPSWGMVAGTRAAARRVGAPGWLVGAGIAGAAVIGGRLLPEGNRAALKETARQVLKGLGEHLATVGEALVEGEQGIAAASYTRDSPPTVIEKMAVALAHAERPLLAREVHECIPFGDDNDQPALTTVRSLLATRTEFVEVTRSRGNLAAVSRPLAPTCQFRLRGEAAAGATRHPRWSWPVPVRRANARS